ncbi:phosphoglycerate kinase [Candidatus Kaiserbacteria bacterium]|nr:phosphoglycerate kinase [Candidatus Kaiserbacteria bacterium]
MRSVISIPRFEHIPILVRAALNVPIKDGKILDDYRLRRALTTVRFLTHRRARVILIGHVGEAGLPAGRQGTETLADVARALGSHIPHVSFCKESVGAAARAAARALPSGHVLVLENLRRHRGETANDPAFAHALAELADVFVQDSFDASHRPHASIVGIPKILPSYAGLLLEEEVHELEKARTPKHPALAAIGGMKFSTKEPALESLVETYDHVFVGGALATDFLKAAGMEIGKSLVSAAPDAAIKTLLENRKLVLPIDAWVVPALEEGKPDAHRYARLSSIESVRPDEVILDHGPGTAALLAGLAQKARAVLWNGPLGNYENGFKQGTQDFARAVADSSARSVIGGGDTIAAIEDLGLLPRFSFISTGGGAMLEFLARGTLPGIEALN